MIYSIQQKFIQSLFPKIPSSMYSFKSSPLIQEPSKSRKKLKRPSKTHQNQIEYQVPNPFRSPEQQNFLPFPLREQIQNLQYISSKSIKEIQFPDSLQAQRRSSNFNKHLMMMQSAAQKQSEKYQGLVAKKIRKKIEMESEEIPQQLPLSIGEMDNLSVDMENRMRDLDFKDFEDQELSIFRDLYDSGTPMQQESDGLVFYSQTNIEGERDFESYFNP